MSVIGIYNIEDYWVLVGSVMAVGFVISCAVAAVRWFRDR